MLPEKYKFFKDNDYEIIYESTFDYLTRDSNKFLTK